MKIRLSAAALAVIASPAFAQSAVTLYGTIDNGLAFANNEAGSHSYKMVQGALGSSKWGFLITEDLGGGYRTVARLENGFDANNGKLNNGGRLFGRQAYVGVAGPFGTLLLGRQNDLASDVLLPTTAALKFGGIWATHVADVDNVWNSYSLSNSIKYVSPTYFGFTARGLYSLGGVPGNFASGRKEAVALSYSYANLDANVVYSKINNPGTALYDATAEPVAGGTFTNPLSNPSFAGYSSAHALRVIGAALNYKFSGVSVGFEYTNAQFQDVVATSSTPFSGDASFNTFELNATYLITPAVLVGTGYTYTKAETAKYGQVNLGAQYYLSKRTSLYAIGVWEHAIGTDSTGHPAVAALYTLSPSSTANQVAFRVGVRHNF
ncbi:porin [Burkholderia anthina]|uniref:porin n=1 Tax=Burkholderia anthina TaxID=179879 RepID=UPI001AA020E3|nr:porin [Burkholderia anthina]QTD94934.1 porin [Burkholderia anthina]